MHFSRSLLEESRMKLLACMQDNGCTCEQAWKIDESSVLFLVRGRMSTLSATQRLPTKRQTLDEAYAPPANFLEIEVSNAVTHGVGKNRYTDYEVRMRTNLPIFKLKESSVRRRYSDFDWLRNELERDSKVVVPPLPGKALKRQLPFRSDDGIFEDSFIEERRRGLEQFINKVAGHPLAQNEKCMHMFLQEPLIDRNYAPGKMKNP